MADESTARKVWWLVLGTAVTVLLTGVGGIFFAYVHNWLGIKPDGERFAQTPQGQTAPNRPVRTGRDILAAVAEDLREADEADRPHRRYLSLVHVANNPNVSDADMQAWRDAVLDLTDALGGLARPIDPAVTLYRLDLRELKWDARAWREVARAYPYALRHTAAEDSTLRQLETEIGELSDRAPAVCVRGDWLVAAAARPPLAERLRSDKELPASVRKQGRAYAATALDLTAAAAEVGMPAEQLRNRLQDLPQLLRDPRVGPLLATDGRVPREKWESTAEFGSSAYQDLCLGLKLGGPLQIK